MAQKHILCLTNIDELIAGLKESRKMHDLSFSLKIIMYILMAILKYTDYIQCGNIRK